MIELLVIKSGEDYLRFSDKGYETCGMNKASVYPLRGLPEVQARLDTLAAQGMPVRLMKLIITEVPFAPED